MPRTEEKRTDPRITTVVPVTCRIVELGASELPSSRGHSRAKSEFDARTVNVSHSGILINSDTDLIRGTKLDIGLKAPTDGHAIHTLTEVAWSRRNSMNLFGNYAAGLRIKKIAERDRALLKEFFRSS